MSLKEDRPSPFTVDIPLKPMSITVVMRVWRTISHPEWPIANVYLQNYHFHSILKTDKKNNILSTQRMEEVVHKVCRKRGVDLGNAQKNDCSFCQGPPPVSQTDLLPQSKKSNEPCVWKLYKMTNGLGSALPLQRMSHIPVLIKNSQPVK